MSDAKGLDPGGMGRGRRTRGSGKDWNLKHLPRLPVLGKQFA